jgi:hypothetical protein
MCGVACCRKKWGKRYTIRCMEHRLWGEVGKQWTEKESFQQYFYNWYKILHTCHTYCCYAYYFYAYWLYFIYVWHVYVSPKTYKWSGTFIIKDGRYTSTFFSMMYVMIMSVTQTKWRQIVRRSMNNKLKNIWTKALLRWLDVISQHFSVQTEENHKNRTHLCQFKWFPVDIRHGRPLTTSHKHQIHVARRRDAGVITPLVL